MKPRKKSPSPVPFPYHTIRKISSPEDQKSGRDVYVGHAPARSFLGLNTDANVRDYLVEAEGKKRRRPTQVHRAMRATLEDTPEQFSILNSGIVLITRAIDVDDKKRIAQIYEPSIINGSQTQGIITDYFNDLKDQGDSPAEFHVKFEIVVADDDDLIAEVSIARNFQNDVMTISIAGRRGQLNELEKAYAASFCGAKLQKSETMLSDDYVKTEKLLQVITALVPGELWLKDQEKSNPNKVYTYSMKAKCLKDFQHLWNVVHGKNNDGSLDLDRYKNLYQFYLDIAPKAWEVYEKWKSHGGFRGTRLRSIERDGAVIKDVPDGIVFPILASLSAFTVKRKGKWTISPPDSFDDKELITSAAQAYIEIAGSNPWNMGKSKACYSQLYQITSIYRCLSKM